MGDDREVGRRGSVRRHRGTAGHKSPFEALVLVASDASVAAATAGQRKRGRRGRCRRSEVKPAFSRATGSGSSWSAMQGWKWKEGRASG